MFRRDIPVNNGRSGIDPAEPAAIELNEEVGAEEPSVAVRPTEWMPGYHRKGFAVRVMFLLNRSCRFRMLVLWAGAWMVLGGGNPAARAQATAPLTRGFERAIPAVISNEEFVRQRDVWAMEVQYKPMRMVWVELPDPQTGELKREAIWYLVWRAINRPISGRLAQDAEPVNLLDPLPGPTQFIPEFTLIVYDKPEIEIPEQILPDQIIPEALKEIRRLERLELLDTVSVVQDLPEVVSLDAEEQPWIYGVATWRGVDPDTDFFNVMFSGFSNAYTSSVQTMTVSRTSVVDGEEVVTTQDVPAVLASRKVFFQRFTRPGDRFDPDLRDFRFSGDPEWIYRPDAAPTPLPQGIGD